MGSADKDVRNFIDRSRMYATNGSAAYKVQPQPYIEPERKRQTRRKTSIQPHKGLKNVLQELPSAVKAELLIASGLVATVMIALMAVQVAVASVTARNNAMIREIDDLESESHILAEQVDSNVDLSRVYEVAENEGLVLTNGIPKP